MLDSGRMKPSAIALVFLAAALPAARGGAFERTFSGAGASATVRIDPAEIDPARDLEAVVSVSAEPPLAAALPADLPRAFDGFETLGSYTDSVGAVHFRLRPDPAASRWRVRPVAVRVVDSSVHPPAVSWLETEPVALPAAPPAVPAARDVAAALEPVSIRPSPRRFLVAALAGLAALAAAAGFALLLRRVRRAGALRRLSPRERALRELEDLLAADLPGRGRFKDFYVELTMVVRRYVERRYAIRAPKLTTGEFLAAAGAAPAFPRASVGPLGAFLEAADLVKFAGASATRGTAAEAASRARAYLDAEPDADRGAGGTRP